jgi:hypothetical protein
MLFEERRWPKPKLGHLSANCRGAAGPGHRRGATRGEH